MRPRRHSTGAPGAALCGCHPGVTAPVFSQCTNMVLYCAVLPDKSPPGGRASALPPDARYRPVQEDRGGAAIRARRPVSTLRARRRRHRRARARRLRRRGAGGEAVRGHGEQRSAGSALHRDDRSDHTYDRSIAANPALATLAQPLREEHRRHAIALAALMGIAAPQISAGPGAPGRPMPPTTAPSPTAAASAGPDTAAARALLAGVETTAQANAVSACLSAPTSRAAVLASIAACRATHVAVLS